MLKKLTFFLTKNKLTYLVKWNNLITNYSFWLEVIQGFLIASNEKTRLTSNSTLKTKKHMLLMRAKMTCPSWRPSKLLLTIDSCLLCSPLCMCMFIVRLNFMKGKSDKERVTTMIVTMKSANSLDHVSKVKTNLIQLWSDQKN